jgi:ribonuclease BN (tRNA processing enzyme)
MRIILLGTGTPVMDPMRLQSALLVDLKSQTLLFDAGAGVSLQMAKAGIQPEQIDTVFITHHHFDHISGLGEFLLTAWHNGRELPLTIYGPQGTAEIVDALLGKIYAPDIAFTLFNKPDTVNIRNLVKVTEITSGWAYENSIWKASTEFVEHGNSLGLSQKAWPCLGYRLEAE